MGQYDASSFVVTLISTITLYLAYMFPIYLNWRSKRRNQGEHTSNVNAAWNLKRWGSIINIFAIVWVIIITILFALPPNELVLWTMVALSIFLAVYWFAFECSRLRSAPHDRARVQRGGKGIRILSKSRGNDTTLPVGNSGEHWAMSLWTDAQCSLF